MKNEEADLELPSKNRKLPSALLNEIVDVAYLQDDLTGPQWLQPRPRGRLPTDLLNELKGAPNSGDGSPNAAAGPVIQNNMGPKRKVKAKIVERRVADVKVKPVAALGKKTSPAAADDTAKGRSKSSVPLKKSPVPLEDEVAKSGVPLKISPVSLEHKATKGSIRHQSDPIKRSPALITDEATYQNRHHSAQLRSEPLKHEGDGSLERLKSKFISSPEKSLKSLEPSTRLPKLKMPQKRAPEVLTQKQLYNVSLNVLCDDLYYQNTDAIVVTTFDRHFSKLVVSLGIGALRLAGEHALDEMNQKLAIVRRSRKVVDQVVTTNGGGNLKCKSIIHISIPYSEDLLKWKCLLTQNIIESLQRCERELRCVSIAIPLLYSSFLNLSLGKKSEKIEMKQECAEVIVSAVIDYFYQMSSRSNIREVRFIDKMKPKALAFKEALEKSVIERQASRPNQTPTQLLCEYTYPDSQTRLIVATGDPMKQPADVLVNPSANFMVAYSGLTAGILIEAALPTDMIQKAFESSKGHQVNTVVTTAGKLPFKHLYHVRGNDELAKDYTQQSLQIETCTYDCLMMAEQAGMETVVLPVISNRYTTIGQYQCSVLMLNAIHRFMTKFKRQGLKEVYVYTGYPSNAFALKDELTVRYGDHVADIKGGEVPLEVLARGLEANIAFIDAIQEGSKSIYQTRLMLVGPERVGKTSLTKALTEQDFDATEEVTDGIETSLSCTLSVKHTTNWKPRPKATEGKISEARQQYLRAVAEKIATKLLQKKHRKKKSKCQSSMKDEINKFGSGELDEVIKLGNTRRSYSDIYDPLPTYEDYIGSVDEVDGSVSAAASETDSATSTPTTPDVPEEVIQLVLEILQEKEKRGETERLEETIDDLTLSIWDFAGQDLYYITHQVFLVSRAIYIICFNLCHDLNAPAKVVIFKREGGKMSVTEHYMNNLDFIIFWLRSIYSNTTENPSGSNQKQLSPPVFIVGTHRESLPGNAEEQWALAEEKLATIKKTLKGTPYEGHVVSKYYAIDNSLRSPLDQSIIELRDHITEVAKLEHYMGEKVPLKWLDFLNEIELLRNQQKHSINFKEVSELAAKCGVDKEMQLFTLLHFYHDLGNIIYYGERDTPNSALNDIIILSPQWLICIFRRVITVKDPSEQWAKFASSWARLDEEGLLEERLIRHMWHDFIDQLEGLLQLMQKFDLLCVKTSAEMPALEGERLFYVPSLLKNQGDEMVCPEQLVKSKTAVVLYIDFNGFLPEGLFYRLLVRIVQWSQLKGGYEPRLFYQKANLYVDEDHDMIIRILPQKRSCIQVAILRASTVDSDDDEDDEDEVEPCPAVCKMVLELLENNLLYLGHTWMKRILFGFYVLCRVCDVGKTHLHELKKCLNSKLVPCGLQRMKTKRFQRLFGECKAKQEAHQATVAAAPVKPKVPVFLRSLSGVFKEISSPILPFDLMTEICVLLDPMHPLSNDWRGLACKLGYDRYINYLARKDSPTMCVMNGWSEKGWSLQDLKQCMIAMNRHDVIRLLDKHLPTEE